MAELRGIYLAEQSLVMLALKKVKKDWCIESGGVHFFEHPTALGAAAVAPVHEETEMAAETSAKTSEKNDDFSIQTLTAAIRVLVKSLKMTQGPIMTVLPKTQLSLRTTILPSTDLVELNSMAQFETERHIPFNAERHSIGHHVIKTLGGVEGSEVLLGAIDGPIVNHALEGIMAAGFKIERTLPSSTALLNAIMFLKPERLKERTLVLLNLGLDAIDLVFIDQGRLIYARSTPLSLRETLQIWCGHDPDAPAIDPAQLAMAMRTMDVEQIAQGIHQHDDRHAAEQAEAWLKRLETEFRLTIDYVRREVKLPEVEGIILTGVGALLHNVTAWLEKISGLDVWIANPVEKLGVSQKKRQEPIKFPFDGFELTLPLGAIVTRLIPKSYQLDLTPQSVYQTQEKKRFSRRLMTTSVFFIIALGVGLASWFRYQEISQHLIQEYAEVLKLAAPRAKELGERNKKLDLIQGRLKDSYSILDALSAVSTARGFQREHTLSLNSFTFVKGKEVQIEAEVPGAESLTDLKNDLARSGLFKEPKETEVKDGNRYGAPLQTVTLQASFNPKSKP